ncbi:hypothetical protein AZF37_02170 [endosymbiont 'TC1' of Trimyema compressum]|uniref:YdcF family protein n=1 Tax=endosymbiont 'TC1' of Trimyema compressum TaxID=243899 RepID=UPI0007F0AE52|nr:YdcF family protein [endosymbiont 'TC1' of Trimyema compressum]AMP20136.1 hypothetical protein AZF37_02170 [endosymbiont 'TC1' of Trimyema compressum]
MIIINIIILITGFTLIIQTINISKIVNFNLGVILPAIIGVILILIVIFQRPLKRLTRKGVGKVLKIIAIALISFYLLAMAGLLINVQINKNKVPSYKAEAVIVLGAGLNGAKPSLQLQKRLNKAIEFNQENKNAIMVVSGGQGADELISEAEAMKIYLVEKGLPEDRIIMESQSKSTYENFVFSKEILDKKYNGNSYNTIFITNDFHVLRASIIADRSGFKNIEGIGSDSFTQSILNDYLREGLAVIKTFIIGK